MTVVEGELVPILGPRKRPVRVSVAWVSERPVLRFEELLIGVEEYVEQYKIEKTLLEVLEKKDDKEFYVLNIPRVVSLGVPKSEIVKLIKEEVPGAFSQKS